MDHVDCIVIGAGVVGLACARAIAQADHGCEGVAGIVGGWPPNR